jgi:ribonuclease P protein component
MLPKLNRLKKKEDFKQTFKKGQLFKEDFLILKVFPNNFKNSRFGFIISSKVSKKAVLRNKIKRWLTSAILGQLKKHNKTKKSADIIIIIKPGVEIKNFQQVEKIINKIFIKIKYGIFS